MSIRKTIDQKLIASYDNGSTAVENADENANVNANEAFVASTMAAVRAESSRETFQSVLRITDINTKETLRMKLRKSFIKARALPLVIVIPAVLLGTSAVGATAYIAYQWIVPKVTVKHIEKNNDDNKKQFTIDQQCGNYATGKDLKFEVAQYSTLTDDEVLKVFENSCKYDALFSFIDSKWVSDNDNESMSRKKPGDTTTIYEHGHTFAGSTVANPIFGFTIGKVVALDSQQLTLSLTLYKVDNTAGSYGHPEIQPFEYYPEGKEFTRTINIASDFEVWQDGQILKNDDLQVGDTVQLVTRAVYELQEYDGQLGLGPLSRFEVAAAIKTDIDTQYVTYATGSGIGNPSIVDAVASLGPCMAFEEYSCVGSANLTGGALFGTDYGDDDPDRKYLRKDIEEKNLKSRSLQGRIQSIDGRIITLQARGKTDLFTIEMPYDVIAAHNERVANGGAAAPSAPAVEVGDLLDVVFAQAEDENHLQIKPGDIEFLSTILQTKPDGTVVKY